MEMRLKGETLTCLLNHIIHFKSFCYFLLKHLKLDQLHFVEKKNLSPQLKVKIQNSKNCSKMVSRQNWDIMMLSKESLDFKDCLKAKQIFFRFCKMYIVWGEVGQLQFLSSKASILSCLDTVRSAETFNIVAWTS